MPALIDIRRRIRSVKNTQQIVILECAALRSASVSYQASGGGMDPPPADAGNAALRAANAECRSDR